MQGQRWSVFVLLTACCTGTASGQCLFDLHVDGIPVAGVVDDQVNYCLQVQAGVTYAFVVTLGDPTCQDCLHDSCVALVRAIGPLLTAANPVASLASFSHLMWRPSLRAAAQVHDNQWVASNDDAECPESKCPAAPGLGCVLPACSDCDDSDHTMQFSGSAIRWTAPSTTTIAVVVLAPHVHDHGSFTITASTVDDDANSPPPPLPGPAISQPQPPSPPPAPPPQQQQQTPQLPPPTPPSPPPTPTALPSPPPPKVSPPPPSTQPPPKQGVPLGSTDPSMINETLQPTESASSANSEAVGDACLHCVVGTTSVVLVGCCVLFCCRLSRHKAQPSPGDIGASGTANSTTVNPSAYVPPTLGKTSSGREPLPVFISFRVGEALMQVGRYICHATHLCVL
eukprot:COSAG02_NODE_2918_length_7752_cov_4.486215_1_plen_397_part_00